MAGDADALSFDLEDAVSESRKDEARTAVGRFLDGIVSAGGKTLIVRVNAMDTPHFEADLDAVARPGLHLVNLPKPASPDAVRAAADALARAGRRNGITRPIGLLLNIETPQALRGAAALGAAHSSVAGLQLGLGDLFEPLGIDRRDNATVHQVMLMLRLAAGEAGVPAYDSAFANIQDAAGYAAEAALARRLGFSGKSCIHPSQVVLANQAFCPTAQDIAHALKVVAAADDAQARGLGAYVVDGRMIDRPFEQRARAVVATARRLGLLGSRAT